MDINEEVIQKSLEHWPVFVGQVVILYGFYKYIIPFAIKNALGNGAGQAIDKKIDTASKAQDLQIATFVDQRLRDHDVKQDEKFDEHENDIDEKLQKTESAMASKFAMYDLAGKERLEHALISHADIEKANFDNTLLRSLAEIDKMHSKIKDAVNETNDRVEHIERKLKMKRRPTSSKRLKSQDED